MNLISYNKTGCYWCIFGHIMIRYYRTRGVLFGFRLGSYPMAEVWLFGLFAEIAWLHREDCECDKCLPF